MYSQYLYIYHLNNVLGDTILYIYRVRKDLQVYQEELSVEKASLALKAYLEDLVNQVYLDLVELKEKEVLLEK